MSHIGPLSTQPSTPRTRRQDPAIQALRGIAVILMVAGHVIGIANRGLRVEDDSLWRYFYLTLADIRMPLFTLISGYVYAMVPVARWQDYPRLMKGKSRRLLLPLITVGTLQYVLENVVPGTNYKPQGVALWRVYAFGFEHLWFLQSIFIIFLVVGILDSSGVLASRAGWFAATAVAAIAFVVVQVPTKVDVFTVSGALRLLPFFLIGYGLRRHSLVDLRAGAAAAAAVAFAGVYAIRLLTIFGVYHPNGYADRAIALAVGAMALVLIYSARHYLNAKLLVWIGGFSFGIYLLHDLATAGTRIVLEHLGVDLRWELFIAGLVMGIAAPIAFQIVFRKSGLVQTFVLGERRTESSRKSIFRRFATKRGSGRTSWSAASPLE
jgi:acyltransferase